MQDEKYPDNKLILNAFNDFIDCEPQFADKKHERIMYFSPFPEKNKK